MSKTQNDCVLIAIVPTEIKDKVVDALMTETSLSGFSLSSIQGFSQVHNSYSLAEQVEGYREFYRFEVIHDNTQSTSLLKTLKELSDVNGIRYWIMPLLDSGVL